MSITASDIKKIIAQEIEQNFDKEKNPHGLDFKKCLIEPVKIRMKVSHLEGQFLDLWLVLEEDPLHHSGYAIFFDESDGMFGLCSMDNDRKEWAYLADYGSFIDTVEGM